MNVFLSNDDCYSKNIGRYLLDNEIQLSPNACFRKMTVAHELLHVLGTTVLQLTVVVDYSLQLLLPTVYSCC